MATIIKNGLVVLEQQAAPLDIRIEGECIHALEPNIQPAPGDRVIDAAGKIVLPGAVDSHVHYHMPTATGFNADDFTSGSACAVVSGTTTIMDFADPTLGKTLPEAMEYRLAEAKGASYADYSMHAELTGDYYMDLAQLTQLKRMGICALKIYTTYGSSEFPPERLPELFAEAKKQGMITLVHAEDNDVILRTRQQFEAEGKTAACYHAQSRPIAAETSAIRKILALAAQAEAPVIIAHISSGEGAQLVAQAQAAGQQVYGETCPHYLLLTDECYQREHPQFYIMTPPLRKQKDCDTLWELLCKGTVGMVSTDHCPFTVEDKLSRQGCFEAIPGIGGSETLLPLMFSEGYRQGRLTLNQLAERLSTQAAKLYGLYPRKGVIAVGSDADLVLVDPEQEYTITASLYPSKAGYTVYEGHKAVGKPVLTLLRGQIVAQDGKVIAAKPQGRFVPAAR